TKPDDGPRLTTGIFGTRILLEELSKNGCSDLAYALANRKAFPSWRNMLDNDATTLWEHWAGSDGTFSHNHPMFGSISGWFFRWLGGIQPAADAVGFDRIEIRPQIIPDLKWVKSSHQSIRGQIVSNWSVKGQQRNFEITIPANTSALVVLPARPDETLTESGQAIAKAKGVKLVKSGPDSHQLRIGSGHYRFSLTK
ncbi:MAG: glycoside hydrolase family 78, partial [Verrucomicrobiae bacterium]|nr:glycoside hydrolase family 78 [Verrucomicrobiae bacterium]NNJ86945.1 glycoside hydrolase family 78 [Akkermansiaceae bacterium]